MKQTAIQWFATQLGITNGSMLEQAIEMEKKQIKKAHIDGSTWPTIEDKMRNSYAELYYNELYNSNNN